MKSKRHRVSATLCGPATIGGFLTQIAQMVFSPRPSRRGIEIRLTPVWKPLSHLVHEIADSLDVDIALHWDDYCKREPSCGGNLCDKIPSYSLGTINKLVNNSRDSQKPSLPWNLGKVAHIESIVGQSLDKLAIFSTRNRDGEEKFSDLVLNAWLRSRQVSRLRPESTYQIGDNWSHSLANSFGFRAMSSIGLTLGEQVIASGHCGLFLSEASGLSTAAIFSRNRYVIFKNPDQHKSSVSRDIGPGGRILFATEGQFFLRSVPKIETLDLILKTSGRNLT